MTPVDYTGAAKAVVDAYNARPAVEKTADYWSDAEVSSVKSEIKDHYIVEQQRRCAWCSQEIHTDNHAVWDAEHIISKNKKPEFMFEPRNLAISCKDCNNAKGEKEVRTNPARISFPPASPDYLIVHPHFDSYEDHIGWLFPICFPKGSAKGQKTIEMCSLLRFSVSQVKGGPLIDPFFCKLLAQLSSHSSEAEAKAMLAAIEAYIRETNARRVP